MSEVASSTKDTEDTSGTNTVNLIQSPRCHTRLDHEGIRHATVFGKERRDLLQAVQSTLTGRPNLNRNEYDNATTNDTVQVSQHARSADLILVSGGSGSGKSTLCRSLKETFETEFGGCFCSGKIDQLQRQHQSNPLIAAVDEALSFVVSKNRELQRRLQCEFSTDLDVLVEHIPSLGGILLPDLQTTTESMDEASSVTNLHDEGMMSIDEPQTGDARTRFHRIYCRLLRVVCSKQCPVLLFLDDLQWGGSETFDLLTEILLDESIEGLVVVAACREVSQDHELCQYLRELDEENGLVILDVVLRNMSLEQHHHHLSELLGISETNASLRELSEMMHLCTGGNHFYIQQIICLLLDEELLRCNCKDDADNEKQWSWDEDGIGNHLQWEEIHELVLVRLKAQPAESQELLKVASCLGSIFDLQTLKAAMSYSWSDLDILIRDTERMNFVVQRSANSWSFAHDRLQQSAYSLIPDEAKPLFHLGVGRRLLNHLPPEDIESKLLLIASQLRLGVTLIETRKEKQGLASVLLRAGKKAAQMTQFGDASKMFETGLSLLPSNHWESCYELSLELYNGGAEAEYIRANFDKVDSLLNEVLASAQSFSDQLRSYTTRIYSLGTRNRLHEAIETGRMVLEKLGEPIPSRASIASFLAEYVRTRLLFSRISDDGFLNLPLMKDPEKLAAVRIMTLLTSYMYWTGGIMSGIISMRIVQLSIKYGISHMSAVGLAFYGSLVCAIGGVDHGYMLGRLALKIVERFNVREWKCRVVGIVTNNIQTWKDPARTLLQQLEDAAQVGFNTGDIEFALVACGLSMLTKCEVSHPLVDTLVAWRKLLAQMKHHRQEAAIMLFSPPAQGIANLVGEGEASYPWILRGEFMQEEELVLSRSESSLRFFGIVQFMKSFVALIMGEYEVSAETVAFLRKHTKVQEFLHPSFSSLHHMIVAMTSLIEGRPRYRRAQRALNQIKRMAKHAPHTHMDKVYLIEGEMAARKGQVRKATMKFHSATASSHFERFLHMEALGFERQSALMEKAGMHEKSLMYLRNARDVHAEWGCTVKLEQIDGALVNRAKKTRIVDS